MTATRKYLLIGLAVFSALLFAERSRSWLFDPDEARYTEIPREMLATGDYLTPRLNGSLYLEKPPLLYWLNAAAMKIGGTHPYTARLVTRLATIGTVLLLLLWWRGTRDPELPFWAALVYLSSLLPFVLGRTNTIDSLVTFTLTLSLLSFHEFIRKRNHNEPTGWALTGLGIGLALGMLAKGLIGVVLPGLVIFVWCALTQSWITIREIVLSRASVLFFVIAAPWFFLMERYNPGFNHYFFVHEHFQRFATESAKRPGPITYFIPIVIAGLLPWTFILVNTVKQMWHDRLNNFSQTKNHVFFSIWFSVVFGFFSASQSKLIPYILPAFPAAAALVALGLRTHHHIRMARALIGTAVIYLVAVAVQPWLATRRSLHDVAVAAKNTNAQWIVAYKTFPQSLPLELGRPIVVVAYQGELASDDVKDPNLFWTSTRFRHLWSSTETVTVVFRSEEYKRLPRHKRSYVVYSDSDFMAVSNFATGQ